MRRRWRRRRWRRRRPRRGGYGARHGLFGVFGRFLVPGGARRGRAFQFPVRVVFAGGGSTFVPLRARCSMFGPARGLFQRFEFEGQVLLRECGLGWCGQAVSGVRSLAGRRVNEDLAGPYVPSFAYGEEDGDSGGDGGGVGHDVDQFDDGVGLDPSADEDEEPHDDKVASDAFADGVA